MVMNLLITGSTPSQRETVINQLMERLEEPIGGLRRAKITPVTHELEDVENGETTHVAGTDEETGPQVEQKHIDVERLSDTAQAAIDDAIRKGRVIVIDTISKVEMHSSTFREAVRDAFRGSEDVIAFVDDQYVDMYDEEGRVINIDGQTPEEATRAILKKINEQDI